MRLVIRSLAMPYLEPFHTSRNSQVCLAVFLLVQSPVLLFAVDNHDAVPMSEAVKPRCVLLHRISHSIMYVIAVAGMSFPRTPHVHCLVLASDPGRASTAESATVPPVTAGC